MHASEPTPATSLPHIGDGAQARNRAPFAPLMRAATPPPAGSPPGAVTSLICGILSVLCCGMPVAGLVLGIVAIVTAGRARSAVQAAPDRYQPSGLATGGLVTGIIGTVLSTLVILFWATVLLVIIAIAGAVGAAVSQAPGAVLPGPVL